MKQLNKYLAIVIAALLVSGTTLAAEENDVEDPTLDQLQKLIEKFREMQQDRVEERRALANNEEIDGGERGELMRALIEEQAMEQRALGQQIRELMKSEHGETHRERRGPPENGNDEPGFVSTSEHDGDLADDIRALNDDFRAARDELLSEWRATVQELQDATREERRVAFEEFRNTRDEQFDALRQNRQDIRDRAQQRAAERRPDRD